MTPNTRTLKGQSYCSQRWANPAWPKGSKSRGFSNYEYLVVGTGKGKLLFYDAKTMKENPELLKEFDLGASIVSVKEVDAFSSSGDRY